jgi:nitrite reductase/ring-hydroxylating ferredoxin subunit
VLIIVAAWLFLPGCRQNYERPYGEFDLGDVGQLIYDMQFVRDKAMLLFRDDNGWSVLSTRCTHEGCELSLQEDNLLCMCCGSTFSHRGLVQKEPARRNLPWYRLRFADNHLYALAGEEVDSSYRFTTPELTKALEKVGERLKEGVRPGGRIPEILLGTGDGESSGPIYQTEKSVGTLTIESPATESTLFSNPNTEAEAEPELEPEPEPGAEPAAEPEAEAEEE